MQNYMKKLNLGFLCSHGGSNMQAIIDDIKKGKLHANACAMISNNTNAFALQRAKNEGIPNEIVNDLLFPNTTTQEIIRFFKQYNVDTIVLAGYMKIVDNELISAFDGRVLNIHPALLPKFGGKGMYGMNVHKAVLEAKEKKSGATIHQVNAEYDRGRILAQMEVEVKSDDTPETLAERVLSAEHIIYSNTLEKIAKEEIIL